MGMDEQLLQERERPQSCRMERLEHQLSMKECQQSTRLRSWGLLRLVTAHSRSDGNDSG